MSESNESGDLYSAIRSKRQRPLIILDSDSDEYDKLEKSTSAKELLNSWKNESNRKNGRSKQKKKTMNCLVESEQSSVIVIDKPIKGTLPKVASSASTYAHNESELVIIDDIDDELAQDSLLEKTREIIRKSCETKASWATNPISLLSEDEESDEEKKEDRIEKLKQPPPRILLCVRINGSTIQPVSFEKNSTLEKLLDKFCESQSIPKTSARLYLDGEELCLSKKPMDLDLEDEDLIEAKVDFTKKLNSDAHCTNKGDQIRLCLRVNGDRREKFKISIQYPLEKLMKAFCSKHNLSQQNVTMKLDGEELQLDRSVVFYELEEDDIIEVKVK